MTGRSQGYRARRREIVAEVDHAEGMSRAREVVLRGLVRGDDVFELRSALVELAIQGDLSMPRLRYRAKPTVTWGRRIARKGGTGMLS